MAVINPVHLLDQADRLAAPLQAGPPRQADLRRAISAAYYAVFHLVLTAMADEFVGVSKRDDMRYVLVYRSLDHRSLREHCQNVVKPVMPAKLVPFAPSNGWGTEIQAFAGVVIELQEKRHLADYDPNFRVKTSDVRLAIATARRAITRFGTASVPRRQAFLTLLAFPPR